MGGYSSGRVGQTPWCEGTRVTFGDLCKVEILGGDEPVWITAEFLETSDGGAMWFRCLSDHSIRGDDVFADYFAEVGDIEFGSKPDDPCHFVGAGI